MRLFRISEQNQLGRFRRSDRVYFSPVMAAELAPISCSGCRRAKAYRLPLHGDFLDGRSSLDWHHSIVAYLEWRAGHAWRPAHHRGPCTVDAYRHALHVVVHAFHTPVAQAVPTKLHSALPRVARDGTSPRREPQSVECGFATTEEVA